MISGLIIGSLVLFVYWVFWLIWTTFAPVVFTDQPVWLIKPKFWQFALVVFTISLIFRNKN